MPRLKPARPRHARRSRKTLDLDQKLLDEARAVLGAETETEAVRVALERVVRNRRLAAVIHRFAGKIKIDRRAIER